MTLALMMQRSYSSQPALSIFLSSPTVGTTYSTYTLRCSGCSVGVTMTAGHFNDPEHCDYDRLAARARADKVANRRNIEWLNAENPKQRKS
jgi:hypothetical protein